MKVNEPIGNPLWAPLFLRLALGAYFILAGLKKLDDPAGFVREIQAYNILPAKISVLYGVLLPYIEVLAGGLLVIGFWTTLGALLCSLMLCSFVIAIGLFPNQSGLFNKDLILLGGALTLMFSGGGAFSIDQFRKSGG